MGKPKLNLFSSYHAEQVFAWSNGEAIPFVVLDEDVKTLVDKLTHKQGDVLISCQSRYAFCVALLASWCTAKVAILLPSANQEGLKQNLPTVAFSCDDAWAKTCGQPSLATHESPVADYSFAADQLAVRLYTSGSTGEPKVIEKTIGNLWYEVESLSHTLDWLQTPVVASVPAYHLFGLTFSVLLPWCLGVAVVDEMPLHVDEVVKCLQQTQSQILVTVPIHLKALMGAGLNLENKQCIVSAAALPLTTAEEFRQLYHQDAIEIYGSSETGIIAYRQQLVDVVWHAFPSVNITSNEEGLLEVASPFISPYLDGMPQDMVFSTADKVVLHEQQRFTLEGRMDAIIKIAGKRISVLNIEQCLMRCHGVKDAAVVAVPAKSSIRDWAIWAAVVVENEDAFDSMAIKRELRKWVEGVAIPRRMIQVAALPRQSNGKLPKKSVMELFENYV